MASVHSPAASIDAVSTELASEPREQTPDVQLKDLRLADEQPGLADENLSSSEHQQEQEQEQAVAAPVNCVDEISRSIDDFANGLDTESEPGRLPEYREEFMGEFEDDADATKETDFDSRDANDTSFDNTSDSVSVAQDKAETASYSSQDDRFSWQQHDDQLSDSNSERSVSSSGSLSTRQTEERSETYSDSEADQFRQEFVRQNTQDTVRPLRTDTLGSSVYETPVSERYQGRSPVVQAPPQRQRVRSMLLEESEVKKDDVVIDDEEPAKTLPKIKESSAFPNIDLKKIVQLPTTQQRLERLHKAKEELDEYDTGLSSYLSESTKATSFTFNEAQLGPNVLNAYKNSDQYHSTTPSTTELANDLLRTSSVIKQKGRNLLRKIHLK
ncbi:hypothetical protein OGAPHI_001154 [Ogataea philodendri]|uniref:Uncharacterized protein n=1 Tax=Ogataea philodendri TaxID=1378263 RepID=A0A9P8T9I7_9ASCO|nr:uncharacterized protein OGAPHI_001154 [Ogataea philodendri]KAH3670639.1 hypothetical protein OGAPHI_001154 [Ogataea philodendri]